LKKQIILASTALLFVIGFFVFGRTTPTKKPVTIAKADADGHNHSDVFDIAHFIADSKQKLTPVQNIAVGKLENSVTRGDVLSQQIDANNKLAAFWKDSVRLFEPYAYYLSQAAKLDNSEKNLTFAAQLILTNLRFEQDEAKLAWQSALAVELFERAIEKNPANDDLKIGLGSCYIYGKGRASGSEETMKGIQQLLAVVKKDSNNMKAQMILGFGGLVSGQYDKAVERLNKVVKAQPNNMEAIEYLANAYSATSNKTEAIKWFNVMRKMDNNPEFLKQVDEKIKSLK
jgi:tetratricopeptide (TPR) repeat protein